MKVEDLKTRTVTRLRKNIDLKMETKQTLSLQAVQYGMSLKSYIEIMLDHLAEMEEDKILAALSNIPEAQTALSGEELEAFDRELRTW